jgi:hypothetical protein
LRPVAVQPDSDHIYRDKFQIANYNSSQFSSVEFNSEEMSQLVKSRLKVDDSSVDTAITFDSRGGAEDEVEAELQYRAGSQQTRQYFIFHSQKGLVGINTISAFDLHLARD